MKPDEVLLRYLANEQMDQPIVETFQKLLRAKGALDGTQVTVEKVASLPNDQRTGKFKLVALQPSFVRM